MKSARLMEVIETVSLRGKGVDGDPVREIVQYWTKEGIKLAEHDDWKWRIENCSPTTLSDRKPGE